MWLNLSFVVYPVLEKFRKYMWGGSLLTENFDIHRVTSWKSFSLNNQLISTWDISYSVLGVLGTCLEMTSNTNLKFECQVRFFSHMNPHINNQKTLLQYYCWFESQKSYRCKRFLNPNVTKFKSLLAGR